MVPRLAACRALKLAGCAQSKESLLGTASDWVALAKQMQGVMTRRRLEAGQLLFAHGDSADCFFVVESGSLRGEVGCWVLHSCVLNSGS